jgi:hypothetical protein
MIPKTHLAPAGIFGMLNPLAIMRPPINGNKKKNDPR